MALKMKKILSAGIAFVLTLGLFVSPVNPETVKAAGTINGHKSLVVGSKYTMYVNEDDLSLVIEDNATGAYMESSISYDDGKNNDTWLGAMKSAVVVTIINGSDDTKQADLINDDVTKNITYTENGFSAELFWNKYGFGMTLEVSLTDEGLVARIPDESIVEKNENYYIGTIAMYPYMGTSYLDEKEGYILIPDGNGALIYLDDKEGRFASGYSAMIYGSDVGFDESVVESLLWDRYNMITDAEKVMAPVFGIAHTEDELAYLAIVEDGAMRASIEACPNGVSVDYNRAYAKFIERKLYTQPTSNNSTSGSLHLVESDRTHSDLSVRYIFLSGDEASYAGMANAYRDYLLSNEFISIKEDEYNTRIDFLGTERESFLLGTKAVVMTTVDDIRSIYEDLAASDVNDILSVYKGWQKGGLYNVPITKYQADSKIGGTKELTSLINDSKEKGIDFYLYNDALIINPDENNATFNVVKKINKRRYEKETYMDVYETFNYLTPQRSGDLLSRFTTSYTKQGIDNLALAGITSNLFSYTYSGTTYSRSDCANSYQTAIQAVDEKSNLIMEQPFAYLWGNTDSFLDMPLYTSSYVIEDESVPFLSIVLKGVMPVYSEYVNFEANKQEFFLKMVETGTYPSFYITQEESSELIYTNSCDIYSSQYNVYRNEIIEYTNALKALNEKVAGSFIKSHEIGENGVTVVTYDNGVKVYVNYSAADQTVDGVTIASMSYEVR
ncbi:MAG: DUF5696 domain-containing protein [Agathobacter sp.]